MCEGIYRNGLRAASVDEACLKDMLRTFGVARNLSKDGAINLLKHLPTIAAIHRKEPTNWMGSFNLIGTKGAVGTKDFYIPGSKTKAGEPRAFISGITKVLWFAGSHTAPMFDAYTCDAIRPKGKSQAEKAVNFYAELYGTWGLLEASMKLEKVAKASGMSWSFFPERFIDNVLLIKGFGNKQEKFLMGGADRRTAYLENLCQTTRDELGDLASPLFETLKDTEFYRRLLFSTTGSP